MDRDPRSAAQVHPRYSEWGKTSITVKVAVKVHRFHENLSQQPIRVTVVEGTCVAINNKGQPNPC